MTHSSSASLLVVATCSYGKRVVPTPDLEIRSLPTGSIQARVQEWSTRLEGAATERVPARRLYKGDHWTIIRELDDVGSATGLAVEVWIASAGYGLIPMNAEIASYGATFAPGHEDFVLGRRPLGKDNLLTEWWSRIATWSGPAPSAARTVTDLAQQHPDTPILVIASRPYARALETDLLEASDALDSPELLSIVAIGLDATSPLAEFVLPGDARFSTWLGGTLTSLNARVARAILEHVNEWGVRRGGIGTGLVERLNKLSPYTQPKRKIREDDEVREYIRAALEANPKAAHSRLLRSFRSEGYACEQGRFRRLYENVKQAVPDLLIGIERS